ncbi:TPA: hypothetical protein NOE89_000907 [Pseudomonas aeruginosa]|nr:hypothetical protein [Pseudomonas aeruginosa]
MSKRTFPPRLPAEADKAPHTIENFSESSDEAIGRSLHSAFFLTENYELMVEKKDAREDEDKYYCIDLNKYWLPANSVYSIGMRLIEREGFVRAIVLVVDDLLRRTEPSKSRHTRVAYFVSTLAKFFEYIWLKDIYDLSQLKDEHFDELFDRLSQGGWNSALDIQSRLTAQLELFSEEDKHHEMFSGSNQRLSVRSKEFQRLLFSNIDAQEVSDHFRAIKLFQLSKGWISHLPPAAESNSTTARNFGFSILRQTLDVINSLYYVPVGLKVFPYKNSCERSRRAARPAGRTKNISPEVAGKLLSCAFVWLYEYSDLVLEMLTEVCSSVIATFSVSPSTPGLNSKRVLRASAARVRFEEISGLIIEGVDSRSHNSDKTNVRILITTLQTACFIVIATLNARRRDEVQHRKLGVHYGCCREANGEMGLYDLVIYVEKSIKDYDHFYAGESTFRAISVLENIQDIYNNVDRALGRDTWDDIPELERTLFSYRRMSRIEGVGAKRCWYEFDASNGVSKNFVSLALGVETPCFPLTPHMFRRLYCLIFMYRYEVPDIRYLSRHLRHGDLLQTQVYVTDSDAISDSMSIASLFGARNSSLANKQHLIDIGIELKNTATEKLSDIVYSIVSGEKYAGGFSRFVRAIYKRFMRDVDFSQLNMEAKSGVIFQRLQGKGYLPETFSHGNCMAGSTRSQRLIASCRGDEGPDKSKASPILCSKCPMHCVNERFVDALMDDLQDMSMRSSACKAGSIEDVALRAEISNLRAVLEYYEGNMGAKRVD